MSNTIEPDVVDSPSVAETTLTVAEVPTDAELIAAAKNLNASVHFHLRRSAEDFWRMGEALTRLHERPSVKGRWRQVLKEIGINRQSANQAERFFAATSLEKLAGYKNKTAALRDLGILPEETPAKKESPDRASKPKTKTARNVASTDAILAQANAAGLTQPKVPATGPEPAPNSGVDETPVEEGNAEETAVEGQPEPAPAEAPDALTIVTQIATRLEYLIGEEFEITPEVAAQVARVAGASKQLWIRAKEVLRAAA